MTPNPALTNEFSHDFTEDFKDLLATIPSGTKLYSVYAIDEAVGGKQILIGNIVLQSTFTTSKFGDDYLFFKH
jgi:hypothetical protein